MSVVAVIGGVVGLVVGLLVHPATAWFAVVELGGAFGESIVSAIGHAVDAAKRRVAESGWDSDVDTLVAQGRASAASGRLLATTVASQLAGLSERLAQPGAEVLDVGTGVAELACALAEALPSVRVVGIDVLDRALRLADRTITEHGLVDRVRVRRQSVADIKESGTFELVWLPLIFIPSDVVRAALPTLHASLRPGAWLIASVGLVHASALGTAIAAWQTQLASGTALTPEQAMQLLSDHGFAGVSIVDTPPGMPVLIAGRRCATDGCFNGSLPSATIGRAELLGRENQGTVEQRRSAADGL